MSNVPQTPSNETGGCGKQAKAAKTVKGMRWPVRCGFWLSYRPLACTCCLILALARSRSVYDSKYRSAMTEDECTSTASDHHLERTFTSALSAIQIHC
ncbi:hypothetical protein QQF64_019353 [Cirrhinus molitorella]|uniref:Uncharacterized protein n=1 Tax=Cirrhinus molitorella TaxID=172907 RepID=A0ABR3LF78_9TELE